MGIKRACPLCENENAWEWPVSGQDKYEIRCDICTIFQLTAGPDKGFLALSKEDRKALSAYVREQFEKTGKAVHLDWVENFRDIIADYRVRTENRPE